MGFDIDFISADLFFKFLLKGLIFSVELTFIATVGGVVVGTVLALMRLSGLRWLELPATAYVNGMRSVPLVMVILWFYLLIPFIIGQPIGAEISAVMTFIAFEEIGRAHV